MTENSPTDRSKLGTKRHILTDKNGIPLSAIITSATSTHDIKAVTEVIYNSVIKRTSALVKPKDWRRKQYQHLCLDRAYLSKPIEQEIIKTVLCSPYTL